MTTYENEARSSIFRRGKDDVFDVAKNIQFMGNRSLEISNAAYAILYSVSTGRMSTEQATRLKAIKGVKAAKLIAKIAETAGTGPIRDHLEAIRAI